MHSVFFIVIVRYVVDSILEHFSNLWALWKPMRDYSCIVQIAGFTATYYTIFVQNSIYTLKLVQDIYKDHVLKSCLTHDYEIPPEALSNSLSMTKPHMIYCGNNDNNIQFMRLICTWTINSPNCKLLKDYKTWFCYDDLLVQMDDLWISPIH